MTGSGTCKDVCDELNILCRASDIRQSQDACDPQNYETIGKFDFIWLHPPYWRLKKYTSDRRDMSNAPTLSYFLYRYNQLIESCKSVLEPGGKIAILMGDYSDRDEGFVPLTYYTKLLCFRAGLKQTCADIVRFQHGNSFVEENLREQLRPGCMTCAVVEKVR